MIEFADWGMRGELAQIWQTCFDDPERPVKYFMNNYFRPENCLVYRAGGKVASVVYLLPAYIEADPKPLQAHYIYAAATLPQYRGRGYMAALLAWAALAGANRGDWYSVVLPANRELYSFYEKSDYSSFFQVRTVSISLSQLCDLAESGRAGKTILNYRQLTALRNSCLADQTGSVLWNEDAFAYAAGISKVYGDKLVCSRTEGRPAYALCRRIDANTCKVLEIMADEETLADLLACLICEMPAQTYFFRLPVGSPLFAQEGEKSAFGMIKPLSGAPLELLQSAKDPYLGLALD
jgi:GNAT superfamily N-acetyltransferase